MRILNVNLNGSDICREKKVKTIHCSSCGGNYFNKSASGDPVPKKRALQIQNNKHTLKYKTKKKRMKHTDTKIQMNIDDTKFYNNLAHAQQLKVYFHKLKSSIYQ